MSLDKRFFRPLGFLSIFAASPMIDAGLQAVRPFFRQGDHLRTLLSLVGIFASLLLLLAGILLCAKLPVGRIFAYWAAAVSTPVCIFSAVIHLMGAHALLYGVGYPIVIVLLLHRATPSSGVPSVAEQLEGPSSTPRRDAHLRSALA
jgi:hypothetical protein